VSQRAELPHGERDPSVATPPRALGSVRRTSSIDSTRPEGLDGPVHVLARARDLATDGGGVATRLEENELRATFDYWSNKTLQSIEASTGSVSLEPLVGCSVASGFRAEVARRLSGGLDPKGLLYFLLDDLPAALQISGHPLLRGGSPRLAQRPVVATTDVCSGWRAGSTMVREIEIHGRYAIAHGPEAPPLDHGDDALAWHELPELSKHGIRRRRRLDVVNGATVQAQAFLRDTYAPADGVETILHEYLLSVEIDSLSMQVVSAGVVPLVLPWIECSGAVGSVDRLLGQPVAQLRRDVGRNFVGPSTCTHLNNMFRSLEDVPTLVELLPR